MQVETLMWFPRLGWQGNRDQSHASSYPLVLYFGGSKLTNYSELIADLHSFYPKADIVGCSTGGEISGDEVNDDSLAVMAISPRYSRVQIARTFVENVSQSFDCAEKLANQLLGSDLKHVLVLSDGLHVNGTRLVEGFLSILPKQVMLTGGLAGDGADFAHTFVGYNSAPEEKQIIAIGFYGEKFRSYFGSMGGWESFGPERRITRSKGNILYELDGKPALELYKSYLGEEANRLPSSALFYPLTIKASAESEHAIVRTIVGVNESEQSMTFAGDVPENFVARLMRGSKELLVEGAEKAANQAKEGHPDAVAAILISCIGRKLLLGQYISEEVAAVCDALGSDIKTVGFYSYGEICPQSFTHQCDLHNQTMTITLLGEES
jgi:hypothetical protein